MDMTEFKAEKRRIMNKWGDKLLLAQPKELEQIHKDVEALCKFAKVRPEKMVNGMATAWLRGER